MSTAPGAPAAGASEAIKVAVRVRPMNKRELEAGAEPAITMQGKTCTLSGYPTPFTFDYCYDSQDSSSPSYASQTTVYRDIGTVILQNSYAGYNGCLFAYGQTGSGKSYSMTGYGGDPNGPALIPRICDGLFKAVNDGSKV
jgi:hypothetical protein